MDPSLPLTEHTRFLKEYNSYRKELEKEKLHSFELQYRLWEWILKKKGTWRDRFGRSDFSAMEKFEQSKVDMWLSVEIWAGRVEA
jgi:hypothetical protein